MPRNCRWRCRASWPCWTATRSPATRSRWCWTKDRRRWPIRWSWSRPAWAGSRPCLGIRRRPSCANGARRQLPACSSAQPGVRAAAEKMLVHGKEYLCVVKYSASFASEQLHSLTTTLSKAPAEPAAAVGRVVQAAGALHRARHSQQDRALAARTSFVRELVHYELEQRDGRWQSAVRLRPPGLPALAGSSPGTHRPAHQPPGLDRRTGGRRLLRPAADRDGCFAVSRTANGWAGGRCITGPTARSASMPSTACSAFRCCSTSTGKPQTAWPGLSMEQFLEELRQIQQFVLLYPPHGEKGPNRVATVLSKQTLPQQSLADLFGLNQLCSTQRR